MSVLLNPVLNSADVVTTTTAPSGSPFTATAVEFSTGFCFNNAGDIAQRIAQKSLKPITQEDLLQFAEYERSVTPIMWRIDIQILASQVDDYLQSNYEEEKLLWKQRMIQTLVDINRRAQIFNPCQLPTDLRPPTASWAARNATGNWCCDLTRILNCIFTNASTVDILRTD